MILYTGESEAIGISPTPIDFIEEQELFIHDSDGTYPLVSSYSFHPFSVTMNKNERRGPKDMSFVGLSFSNDRIIAFADSKGSIMDKNGKMKWDKKRGKLQKIFKTENFVMVTFGTNEFDAGKYNRIRVYLEDWVNANISKYKTPSAFAKGMYSYMNRMNVQVGKNKVAFIAGYREKEMNYWEVIYITPESLSITTKSEKQVHSVYGGNETYIKYFDENSELLEGDEKQIRENIEKAVYKYEESYPEEYNPVGCPVITEEFFF